MSVDVRYWANLFRINIWCNDPTRVQGAHFSIDISTILRRYYYDIAVILRQVYQEVQPKEPRLDRYTEMI